ncbi:MAG TPA: CoA ester lyase [Acidobacteriaceae bacterium]|jgi:citrate lyase subunit beta/citryl-CoA lyase|nr:CoA ester lyase [Acidobacteriaceae bacterium]
MIDLMRSKLFVPASRPEFFPKALASQADAICWDLEDSVVPARREEARQHLRQLFSELQTNKVAMVRVNPVASSDFAKDLRAAVSPALAVLALPKVSTPDEVREAAWDLSALEKECDLKEPIAILPTIETPRGLRLAREIAESSPRIAGLQLGLADLFGSVGVRSDDAGAAQQVRFRMRLAAAEAGVPCFDSAFADFRNADGFVSEAVAASDMGFSGKSCIHPDQIAAANRIFSPGEEEVAAARRIVEAIGESGYSEAGALALDGRMVDAAGLKRAEQVIHLANRIRTHQQG